MIMFRNLMLLIACAAAISCTSSRWVVTDQFALDESAEPVVLDQKTVFAVEKEPTVDDPVITFAAYDVTDLEYPLRVKVERSVQQYRPGYTFLALGLTGVAFSVLAANSDVILEDASGSQRAMLNISAGVIGALSFANMKPRGEPIYTGESELMRRSGVEVVQDSLRKLNDEDFTADLQVTFEGEELFSQSDLSFSQSALDINLASFASSLQSRVDEESVITIRLTYDEYSEETEVRVRDFLVPHLNITVPIAVLRNTPEVTELNAITEVGRGSFLEILEKEDEWVRVRFEELEAYVERESGDEEWLSTAESGPALIFEFAELPFGEIDVENSLPILKTGNEDDRALILTNGIDNGIGIRQYLERDHRLFSHYMRTSFQMRSGQVRTLKDDSDGNLLNQLRNMESMGGSGSLYVYLSGFADYRSENGESEIKLVYRESDGETNMVSLEDLMRAVAEIDAGRVFLFADLEYAETGRQMNRVTSRNGSGALQAAAERITRQNARSVVVFSNRPGQHSGLYTGMIDGNMRHHIFNYFWADAIKKRKITVSALLDHLDSNVDYTSRRLHDRPQEIQAFGNFSLHLVNE